MSTPNLEFDMFATFGSAMTGVAESDFLLTGCTGSLFEEVTASVYKLHLTLNASATVKVRQGACDWGGAKVMRAKSRHLT